MSNGEQLGNESISKELYSSYSPSIAERSKRLLNNISDLKTFFESNNLVQSSQQNQSHRERKGLIKFHQIFKYYGKNTKKLIYPPSLAEKKVILMIKEKICLLSLMSLKQLQI